MHYTKKRIHPSLGTEDIRLGQQQERKRLMEIIPRELKEKLEQIKRQTKTIRGLTHSYANKLHLTLLLVDTKNQNILHNPENRGKQSRSKD